MPCIHSTYSAIMHACLQCLFSISFIKLCEATWPMDSLETAVLCIGDDMLSFLVLISFYFGSGICHLHIS
jgi:hypothetical protein